MNKAYTQGFMDKCAEAGIDPEELVKRSNLMALLSGGRRMANLKSVGTPAGVNQGVLSRTGQQPSLSRFSPSRSSGGFAPKPMGTPPYAMGGPKPMGTPPGAMGGPKLMGGLHGSTDPLSM